MDTLGTDFNVTGSVMTRSQLEEVRQKRGECLTCGRKCFRKKLFKMDPITEEGKVLEGRCLNCRPLNGVKDSPLASQAAAPRRATPADLERFTRSQSNLSSRNLLNSPGASPKPRRSMTRAASNLSRSDNYSVGSSSTTSRPSQNLRRAASMMSAVGANKRQTSLSPPPSTRSITHLNSTEGDATGHSGKHGGHATGALSLAIEGHHSFDDLGSISELPRIDRSTRENLALRRSSHSDAINGPLPTATGRSVPPKSQSGDFPTHEELERAHRTILAARQHGIYDDRDNQILALNDIEKATSERELQGSLNVSARSFRSAQSIGGSQGYPDEIDGYAVPQRGVLNRGGSFPIAPGRNGVARSGQYGGSAQSFSSMSSMEDKLHGSTPPSANNSFRAAATTTPMENIHIDGSESGRTSSMSERRIRDVGPSEQQYLERLRRVGQNYADILLIIRDAMDYTVVVSSGLEQLARMKLSPEEQDVLGERGALLVITDVMNAHPSSLSIQLSACGAIWNMSGTAQNQVAAVDAGGLDMILTAMNLFPDNVELQEKAIASLSNLGALSPNLPILEEKGIITRIVNAMNKYAEVSSLQVKGCVAVTNLASHDVPMKQRIVEHGAGGAVVVSMVMHPNDPYLQEKALRALRNLCANCDANKIELANIGGIDSVISAMQVHRDELGVQQEGARTLSNLAGNKVNKAVIGNCGGVDVVIRAMWVHSDAVGLQEWCCRALFTLTLEPQNGGVVLEVGGISAVINSMQGHVDSTTVQEMGCAVLCNLAESDQIRMRIVHEEALDAIVLAMVLHTDDMQVQERACTVLVRLAIPSNINSMKAANIAELVQTAARKFPDQCEQPSRHILGAFDGAYN